MQLPDLKGLDTELAIGLLLQGANQDFKDMFKTFYASVFKTINNPSDVIPQNVDEAASLLQTYRRAGKGDSAGRCALRMLESGFATTTVTFNQVLSACAQKGDVQSLWYWWGTLMLAGYKWNLVSFNILLNACARSGNQQQAECCIRAMVAHGKVPSLVGLSSLIDCFGKAGNVDKAEAWFKEVLAFGVKPDVIVFNVLISAFGKVGDLAKASRLVASMWDYGLRPDTTTYNCLLDACSRFGDSDQVDRFLAQMEKGGVVADGHTFGSLMNVYSKKGDVERCVLLMEQMTKAGIQPTILCYNMIMHACALRSDPQQAEQWLSRMEWQGLQPNGVTYSSLLSAHSRANDWDGIVSCVQRIATSGVGMDHITLGLLLRPRHGRDPLEGHDQAWDAYCLLIRTLLGVGDVKNLWTLLVDVPATCVPTHAWRTRNFFRQICLSTSSDAELVHMLYESTSVNNSGNRLHCNTSNLSSSRSVQQASPDQLARLSRLLSKNWDNIPKAQQGGLKPLAPTHKNNKRSQHTKKERQQRKPQLVGVNHAQVMTYGHQLAERFDGHTSSDSTTAISQSWSDDGGSSQGWNQPRSPCQSESEVPTGEAFFL